MAWGDAAGVPWLGVPGNANRLIGFFRRGRVGACLGWFLATDVEAVEGAVVADVEPAVADDGMGPDIPLLLDDL